MRPFVHWWCVTHLLLRTLACCGTGSSKGVFELVFDGIATAGFFVVVFFLTFIMVVSFIILNLFIGVVTSSLNQATREVLSMNQG